MATTKKRLNITLPAKLEQAISVIAKRDSVPAATKITELLKTAVEIEEDEVLLRLAQSRDTKSAKFIEHDEFWNKLGI
jgi:hypothetical protein